MARNSIGASQGSSGAIVVLWHHRLRTRHIFLAAGEGSESDCGSDRTGFYPGIIPDHQQIVGELRRSLETLHKAGLECAQIAAHFVQQYTCGEG